ncbi:hypothetical protein GEV38_21500 [Pseudomonas sp. 13159349]|uniref:hypothetical protein n=1 Tax=Pseudomonas sp. 13159349 TaxID=2662034 RepID=UPI00156D79BD|nr:hypothetical protein [Pseudomonas sp. 13159349]QKK98380.1 hypothetical protein GEV38_21500 [Pseudomonas sp. 13159349]
MKLIKLLATGLTVIGGIGAIIGLAIDSSDFMEKFFYKHELWTGKFSTTTEYSIITGDYPEIPEEQPRFIININSSEGTGIVRGEMFSEKICKFNPVTWYFYIDSETPDYLSLGKSRKFILSYLMHSKKVPIAELRITMSEPHDAPTVMEIKPLSLAPGLEIPEKVIAGNELAAYQEDYDHLQKYCADVNKDFHLQMMEIFKERQKGLGDKQSKGQDKDPQKPSLVSPKAPTAALSAAGSN